MTHHLSLLGRLASRRVPGSRSPRARVLFVCYQDQDNLGVRYLSSRLREQGHETRLVSPSQDIAELERTARRFDPLVVGFSLIFQFHVASFRHIAARTEQGISVNASRAGRDDLDALPWPDRDDIDYEREVLPMASILGSRGCPWRCSFCSIITFYEANGTRGRRRRDPRRVVDEMEHLQRRGVRVLLWQDDDFLAGGKAGVAWAHAIAEESVRRGLHRSLSWKISCRSDEIKDGVLAPLVQAGLTHVYMGVESGDPDNLRSMNKLLLPEVHLRAGEMLRELGLSFDFGFMLLEPWSTLATVRNNLSFLRRFVGDGAAPIPFCRTLPYAGTPIEQRLREEGRLDPDDCDADYRFLDARLDVFYDFALRTFSKRNHERHGVANLLRLLLFHAHRSARSDPSVGALKPLALGLTRVSNSLLLEVLEAALAHLESIHELPARFDADPVLDALSRLAGEHDARLLDDVRRLVRARPRLAQQLPALD